MRFWVMIYTDEKFGRVPLSKALWVIPSLVLLLSGCGTAEKPVIEKIELRLEKKGEIINGNLFELDYTGSIDS
ncbi:MAG TPA: hypothetical protein VD905_02275, partial [Flavobacteriales bacterium]|nr:hypothetical protein [Flavobacteriales bacterium]